MSAVLRFLPWLVAGSAGLGVYHWSRQNMLVTAGVATVAAAGAAYLTYRVMK